MKNAYVIFIYCFLFLLLYSSFEAKAGPLFRIPTSEYYTGQGPNSLTASDFNLDGSMDIAIGNSKSNAVSVFYASENGDFISRLNYATGSFPRGLKADDFNNDGKPDLVVANYNETTISVFLNQGDGTFAPRVDFTTSLYPRSIAIADFNRDGFSDLAVACKEANLTFVFLGQGDGMFATSSIYEVGNNPYSIVAEDFDEDGKYDIAVANNLDNTISTLLLDEHGLIKNKREYAVGNAPYCLIAADFNNDGYLDLGATNSDSDSVSIILGLENGLFSSERVDYTVGITPRGMRATDLNQDNNLDLIVANEDSNNISILYGRGDGSFEAHIEYTAGNGPEDLLSTDMNKDTIQDIVVINNRADTFTILFGNAEGQFILNPMLKTGDGPNSITVTDINGDGSSDIVTANINSSTLSLFLGNGDGSFKDPGTFSSLLNDPYAITASDFDLDGYSDLAIVNKDPNQLVIAFGSIQGTYHSPTVYMTGKSPCCVLSADFNLDGQNDILLANSWSDTISMYLNSGGIFTHNNNYFTGLDSMPLSISSADFNKDNYPDCAIGNNLTDTLTIFFGDTDGSLTHNETINLDYSPCALTTTDIDNNGYEDIIIMNQESDTISIVWGQSGGSFLTSNITTFSSSQGPCAVATADFNGDTYDDLAVVNNSAHTVSLFTATSQGISFSLHAEYPVGKNPCALAMGDLNNDQCLDLVVANRGSNNICILLGTVKENPPIEPPSRPIIIDDGAYTSINNSLHASWHTEDDFAGQIEYYYTIDTLMVLQDSATIGWIPAGSSTEIIHNFTSPLSEGHTYYFHIKAKNSAGWSSIGHSDGITIDSTSPILVHITIINSSCDSEACIIESEWNIGDTISGIMDNHYALDSNPNDSDTRIWTSVGQAQELSYYIPLSSLNPEDGYYLWVKAQNGAGLWSTPKSSHIIAFTSDVPDEDSLTTPIINNPVSGAIVSSLHPILSVTNADILYNNEIKYDFEVYTAPGLTPESLLEEAIDVPEGLSSTYWRVETNLSDNNLYYWHARSHDATSCSKWTPTAVFKVSLNSLHTESLIEISKEVVSHDPYKSTLMISNLNSSLYNTAIEVPPEAFSENTILSIGVVFNPPPFPDTIHTFGPTIFFGPNGVRFDDSRQPTIMLPYNQNDLTQAGVTDINRLTLYAFNTDTFSWENLSEIQIDQENTIISAHVTCFSMYGLGTIPENNQSKGFNSVSSTCFISEIFTSIE
ncbi:MAG: FG-GAP-like repeat-containing protein [bacterium]